jgi:hypothetical protein
VRTLVLLVTTLFACPIAAVAQGSTPASPPVAPATEASSLRRASQEWEIRTRVTLAAMATHSPKGMQWRFRVLNPQSRVRCLKQGGKPENPADWLGDTTANVEVDTTDILEVLCEYQPPVKKTGKDTFEFEVEELKSPDPLRKPLLKSAPATVTVDIKPQGLRWQFVTGGTTVKEGGLDNVGSVPDLIGKTNGGDFMLNLDWVIRHPQKTSNEARVGASADSHIVFHTGYITRTEAVTATPVPAVAGGTTTTTPAAAEDAVAARRKFTFGGEWNYNWVLTKDDNGVFAELGLLGRGSLDIDVEDKETLKQTAGRILQLTRKNDQSGTLRAEWGGRFALKQKHEEMFQTTVTKLKSLTLGGTPGAKPALQPVTQTYNRNSDDLLAVEFGWLRDEALADIQTTTGFKQGRYFIRGLFTLVEIPGAPGHSKPMFGFELTDGADQPRQVKFLYGADISAIGTLFGVGK